MIHIDGSQGEGGGQILRSALALSLLTGKPFRLDRIRAHRAKPGLMPQHLKAVQAAAEIGDARVLGARVGSMALEFVPGRVQAGDYVFDIGTAGATSLVLQTVYLPLAFAGDKSSLTLVGGTHVPFSPCFHYLERNWRCFLEASGLELSLKLERAGFYPPGGGIVRADIPAVTRLRALHRTERGRLLQIRGSSAVANLTMSIAERQRDRALRRLSRRFNRCEIELEFLEAYSPGTMLLLVAEFEHSQAYFFSLGQRGKRAEQVADETVDALLEFLDSDGAVDAYLADQLLLPLAFAKGESLLRTSKVTGHMLTNADIIGRFLPIEIGIQAEDKKSALVRICPPA